VTIPQYESLEANSQTIAVLTGFVHLMLEASPLVESVLGKPLAFNDNAFYPDDEVGIFVMTSAPKPALALTVSVYIADPNAGPGLTQYAVQVRARSDSPDARPAIYLLDALRENDGGPRLNGRAYANLHGYVATIIYSHNLGDMGLNSQDQYELTENYYLVVNDEPERVLPEIRRTPITE
jgi:hypothetical protein